MAERRAAAWERFGAAPLPDESADLWKYSGIADLDLDRFGPAPTGADEADRAKALAVAHHLAAPLGPWAGLAVTLDGVLVATDRWAAGDVTVRSLAASRPGSAVGAGGGAHSRAGGAGDSVGRVDERVGRAAGTGSAGDAQPGGPGTGAAGAPRRDAFDDLHLAFAPDEVVLEVRAKAVVEAPLVVVHLIRAAPGTAAFPRMRLVVGASAEVGLVEVWAPLADEGSHAGSGSAGGADAAFDGGGADAAFGALVLPVTEIDVAENAHCAHATMQFAPRGTWQLAVQAATVARDASYRAFNASLGRGRSRVRAEVVLGGQGAEASLCAGYLGTGDQLHDLRTVHDHVAPQTRSQLLCKGAVSDHARSVYVGQTHIRRGAHGSDAFQTNHNLVLAEGAHADSIPNLDIEENDVRCSHASTVGPVDDEQRYYLESRGIGPARAERMIVAGFFHDLSSRSPLAPAGRWFDAAVGTRLERGELIAGSGSAGEAGDG